MKNLCKIVFINSANIPYQEIPIDGNVHFGGTNGVGKSTVLRAILFFYNADKSKLGIEKGQSSFEDFYLPNVNSYIIYEVASDNSSYFVVVSRHKGKIAFRFVDTPYSRRYIVDSDGFALSDFNKIRTNIGPNIDISNILDKSSYRSILFGNLGNEGRKYLKYSIARSPRYENITRSIQNVYLNSKLDADFMKGIIIQSLPDYDFNLPLDKVRSHLYDYHQELMDVQLWFKKEPNGEILIRKKADDIISAYRNYVAADKLFVDTWHKLKFAVRQSKSSIPSIENDVSVKSSSIEVLNKKINSLESDFKDKHESFLDKISKLDGKLSDIRAKKKKYKDMDILAMLALDSQENKYKEELNSKEKVLNSILDQAKDIKDYYRAIYSALNDELIKFSLSLEMEMAQFRDSLQNERDTAQSHYVRQRESADAAYQEFLHNSEQTIDSLNSSLCEVDNNISKTNVWHPKRDEINSVSEQISNLTEKTKEYNLRISTANKELNLLYRETESEIRDLTTIFENKRDNLSKEITNSKKQCFDLETILSNTNGSLYEWLSENKPDWEHNIGKVVNETVLYSKDIQPSLSSGDCLYGIDLNLDVLPACVCMPNTYKMKVKSLKSEIDSKTKEVSELTKRHNQDVEKLNKSFKIKIKDIKLKLAEYEHFIQTAPQKSRDLKTILLNLEKAEKGIVDERLHELNSKRCIIVSQIDKEKSSRTQKLTEYEKTKLVQKKKYDGIKADVQKRLRDFSDNLNMQKRQKESEIESKRSAYEKQESLELTGKNVDGDTVEIYRKEIQKIQTILDRISNQKRFVIGYYNDKAELFDHEFEFKESKLAYESKDSQLNHSYVAKREQYTNEVKEISMLKSRLESNLSEINESLSEFKAIVEIENMIPDNLLNDMVELENNSPCSVLIKEMRRCRSSRDNSLSKLKSCKNAFFEVNSRPINFKTLNIVNPDSDDIKDLLNFASILQDFIINDKIEEFRKRTSEHVNDIILTISKQFGIIEDKKASVKSTIDKINRDFKKYNFAQVIRRIELRMDPESDDSIASILSNIHKFTIENNLNIGALNLFSDTDNNEVNQTAMNYLYSLKYELDSNRQRTQLSIYDTFRLLFQVEENDKCTQWVEKLSQIGSNGTSVLVKAMINIMLISIYKSEVSNKYGEFIVHCIMDEIGTLDPKNVSGLLNFANMRNIHIITGSPVQNNGSNFKYNYFLEKDHKAKTHFNRYLMKL